MLPQPTCNCGCGAPTRTKGAKYVKGHYFRFLNKNRPNDLHIRRASLRKLTRSYRRLGHPQVQLADSPIHRARRRYEKSVWAKYRLTLQDVAIMYESQSGTCLCGEPLGQYFDIDHAHKWDKSPGLIRGLLHRICNRCLHHDVDESYHPVWFDRVFDKGRLDLYMVGKLFSPVVL